MAVVPPLDMLIDEQSLCLPALVEASLKKLLPSNPLNVMQAPSLL